MSYYKWKNVIDANECEKIIEEYSSNDYLIAEADDKVDTSIRKTYIQWIPSTALITRALESFVMEANTKWFKFDLDGHEQIQFARYKVGDEYGFHKDQSSDNKRKLSVTVQLSNKKEYEGGEFQFYTGEKRTPETPDIIEQGSVMVFDSRDWHRVTPITKGIRYSLTMWVHGPPFK